MRALTRARRLTVAAIVIVGTASAAPAAHGAATARVGSSQLTVTGDDRNDQIQVQFRAADGKYAIAVTDDAGGGIAPGSPAPGEASSHCVQGASANQVVCDRLAPGGSFLVRVDGLAGDDTIGAGYGALPWHPTDNSRLAGGAGDDLLGGSPRHDTLIGGADDDGLDGAAGDDVLLGGGTFADAITVPGSDRLFGGPGSDELEDADGDAGAGSDQLDGGVCPVSVTPCSGAGSEAAADEDFVIYFDREAGVTVNLSQQTGNGAAGENDSLRNLEGTFTGAGADQVTGNARINAVFTLEGNDTVNLSGDAGSADSADCGEGADTITKDADDATTDCETTTGGPGGGTSDGGGTTGGGATSGSSSGTGTTASGGQQPAATDTTGPTIVVPASNKTLTASRTGSFGFAVGPFSENASGTVAVKSAPVTTSRATAAAKKVVLNLGTKSFMAKAGQKQQVRFKLSAKHRKILVKRKKIRMTATIVARDTAGNATTRKVQFTLKAPKRKR